MCVFGRRKSQRDSFKGWLSPIACRGCKFVKRQHNTEGNNKIMWLLLRFFPGRKPRGFGRSAFQPAVGFHRTPQELRTTTWEFPTVFPVAKLPPRYGWFQWYCRFFQGRRSEDDVRQIQRWLKICGPTGLGVLEVKGGGRGVWIHPRKVTCPLKRGYFSRKYIFQPVIFRGHVSFPGGTLFEGGDCLKGWVFFSCPGPMPQFPPKKN